MEEWKMGADGIRHPSVSTIIAYAEGKLKEKDNREVSSHIETCEVCRQMHTVLGNS